MKSGLLVWGTVALGLIVFGALLLFRVDPASKDVAHAATKAENGAQNVTRLVPIAAGPKFEQNLLEFARDRDGLVRGFDDFRANNAMKLLHWFGEIKVSADTGAPTPDEFKRGYAVHRDALLSTLHEKLRVAIGGEGGEFQVMKPEFVDGAPPPAADFDIWQCRGTIEEVILDTLATQGARNEKPIVIEREPRPINDDDPRYERFRIRIESVCETKRCPAVLHKLVGCFDEYGGTTRVDGVGIRPVEGATPMPLGSDPPVRLLVTLSAGFFGLKLTGEAR